MTFHNCFPVSDGDSVAQNVLSLLSNPLPASEGEAKREVSHMCADLYVELFLNSLLFESSLYRVAALKRFPVHRYSVVIFTFPGPLGLENSTLIWEYSSAQPGAKWCEGCRTCHYLSRTDSLNRLPI